MKPLTRIANLCEDALNDISGVDVSGCLAREYFEKIGKIASAAAIRESEK